MVDPPTYRADPDPEFADHLERVLLERLTAGTDAMKSRGEGVPSDQQLRLDAVPDDRRAIIMLDTEHRNTGPIGPRSGSPGRWLLVAAAVAVVAVVGVLAAVGGEDDKPLDTVTATTTAPPEIACPLTADEVSEVIGEIITGPESATNCYFGQTFPSVSFSYLPGSACTRDGGGEVDGDVYVDAVDGLGLDAYSKQVSLGVSLLVCDGDRPFSVVADGVDGDPLTTAVELARLVLDG